ncbi:hypothetical protein XBJ2_330002 [Xenorhabdus bovienii str. Jollieti]|uniref:Uncharacterized protein n=1 Tax=Xenorhabdus bovienii (strain SS-2004) TaxID=406818 RepID=D3UWM3_XENBS|nr:hypothetical protein XBJ1_0717 [Xenorhabdus bovienii SS-2004]CDH29576.1 hypothetical protein XBJ2_330002 [Xenorhabdus bovienii str. Jollieti]
MELTARQAETSGKDFKLSDGRGLLDAIIMSMFCVVGVYH